MYEELVLSELKLKNVKGAYSQLCDLFWIPHKKRAKDSKGVLESRFL